MGAITVSALLKRLAVCTSGYSVLKLMDDNGDKKISKVGQPQQQADGPSGVGADGLPLTLCVSRWS